MNLFRFCLNALIVLSWVALGLGVFAAIVILIGGGTPQAPRMTSLLALFLGVVYFVIFYSMGKGGKVLLSIGEKTQKAQ